MCRERNSICGDLKTIVQAKNQASIWVKRVFYLILIYLCLNPYVTFAKIFSYYFHLIKINLGDSMFKDWMYIVYRHMLEDALVNVMWVESWWIYNFDGLFVEFLWLVIRFHHVSNNGCLSKKKNLVLDIPLLNLVRSNI